MLTPADNRNTQHFQVPFSKGWSWHTLDECLCFFLGKAAEKVVILSLSMVWQRESQGVANSFPHSCPIPLCATAYAPGTKSRGIPCSMMQSNRSSLGKVTAALSCPLHRNGFQIFPINNVLPSGSCWGSRCTSISDIDGSWHNHSSQTTTANLSVLLGSAVGTALIQSFWCRSLLVIGSVRAFSNLWRHAKYFLREQGI